MYKFLLNQWIMKKIDAETLHSYVPKWITEEQYKTIINTPQVV